MFEYPAFHCGMSNAIGEEGSADRKRAAACPTMHDWAACPTNTIRYMGWLHLAQTNPQLHRGA